MSNRPLLFLTHARRLLQISLGKVPLKSPQSPHAKLIAVLLRLPLTPLPECPSTTGARSIHAIAGSAERQHSPAIKKQGSDN
jgi:hypothetical protein